LQDLQPVDGVVGSYNPIVGAKAASQHGLKDITSLQITVSDKQHRSTRIR
jgi:hypothetical protein